MKTKQLFLEALKFVKDRLFGKTPEVTYKIDELLAGSSKASMSLNKEDREWFNNKPVGKEVI